jgi:hypothetical protein
VDRPYVIVAGSAAEAFHNSRKKIRLYGGGFGNGKTTAAVAEALKLIRDYPGSTGLMARATYPKLNSTLRREFFKWCPPSWIKGGNKNDNTWQMVNGTIVDFRYIAQKYGTAGDSSSNLLSASYDWIIVDQIEDPEIEYADFLQLFGRLRGSTKYAGDDPTMPATGPRFMILTCNPALGWVYDHIVKPLHDFRRGIDNPNLLCETDLDGKPLLVDGKKVPIVDVFEASTLDNAQNVPIDYVKTLLATYTGRFRDRYIFGKWVAFEGTVYDEFDPVVHVQPRKWLQDYLADMETMGYTPGVLEAYDFGIAEPSCYLLAGTDDRQQIMVVDGFYESGLSIEEQANRIKKIREANGLNPIDDIRADPSCFRRNNAAMRGGARSVAAMFADHGILMRPASNAIVEGIIVVKQALQRRNSVVCPFTQQRGAPRLYFADHLRFITDEMVKYRWKQRKDGEEQRDEPIDKDNHSMDCLRYMLNGPIPPARLLHRRPVKVPPQVLRWGEGPIDDYAVSSRQHRYAS